MCFAVVFLCQCVRLFAWVVRGSFWIYPDRMDSVLSLQWWFPIYGLFAAVDPGLRFEVSFTFLDFAQIRCHSLWNCNSIVLVFSTRLVLSLFVFPTYLECLLPNFVGRWSDQWLDDSIKLLILLFSSSIILSHLDLHLGISITFSTCI